MYKCSCISILHPTHCHLMNQSFVSTHMRSVVFSTGSTQSLPCHTASGDNCTSSICPNTVVTYTCTITNRTIAAYTDWTLPTGTCPSNTFPNKIRLSQFVSGSCSAQGQTGISMCGPYTASSIQSSDPTYCLSSILTVNITAAMNGSTVTCSNTDQVNPSITTIVSSAIINVHGRCFYKLYPSSPLNCKANVHDATCTSGNCFVMSTATH